MKKTLRKIVPAIAMLLISATLVGTSTFAWFSMNNRVTINGMSVTTRVSSNLQIAETNAEANFGNSLAQTRAGLLEPSSTINGISYFYTNSSNVAGNGDALAETYSAYSEATEWASAHTDAGKTHYDEDFNENYGITSPTAGATTVAYGYIDYTFYLKAVNTEGSAQDLKLSSLSMKYNGGQITSGKAWRVALIAHEAVAATPYNDAFVAADVISIFTLDSAANFTANSAVSDATTVATLSYGASKTAYNQAGTIANIGVGAVKYYKVTVRLWLEGEDNTCTSSTYATLTSAYTLDLAFELATANTAVDKIATYGAVATDDDTATASISGVASPTYQWYNATGDVALDGKTAATYDATADISVYCIITANGQKYKTNTVALDVA